MRVITESEGWRVEVHGSSYVVVGCTGVHDATVTPHCPTEALLAIVADREGYGFIARWLDERRDRRSVALAELAASDADLIATRSPDTKQEEGR